MTVVTRFAPSPTGYLHIGGARTALFNYLFAKHHGGEYKLRIEDTDKERKHPEAVAAIHDGLDWLGLYHDGDVVFQSANADRHREVAYAMAENGTAYWDYTSKAELEAMRAAWKADNPKTPFRYLDNPYRSGGHSPFVPDEPPVLRLVAPRTGFTVIEDAVQGRVEVPNDTLDDMILLRSDKSPTYMLAVVVDDHDMGVTHVIRGNDHLTNAFRQVQIIRAMGWQEPVYAHIPLIHDETGKKFSKRTHAVAVGDYREQGILSDAMVNYLVKLGWGHGDDEKMSRGQMIEWFDLPGVGRGPSRFDMKKLTSLNGEYIRAASDDWLFVKLTHGLFPTIPLYDYTGEIDRLFFEMPSDETLMMLRKAIPSLKLRVTTLVEMIDMARFYVERPDIFVPQTDDLTLVLEAIEDWTAPVIEAALRDLVEKCGNPTFKFKDAVAPLRLAITGSKVSPPLFEAMELLGRDETLLRSGKRTLGEEGMNKPPYRFSFQFHHDTHPEGDEALFRYWFAFNDESQVPIIKQLVDESDEFIDQTEELEEFGIHDFSTIGDYELVGFHTYEIEYDKWLIVVNEWRNFFVSKGIACGLIVMMASADYEKQFRS